MESTRHKELMRRMVELKRAGKNVDLLTFTTLPDLESFGGAELVQQNVLDLAESIGIIAEEDDMILKGGLFCLQANC